MSEEKCPKKILYVEDNPKTIQRYTTGLEESIKESIKKPIKESIGEDVDVKVTPASTLLHAYQLLEQNPNQFDMVLIDLNMPPIPDELSAYGQRLRTLDLNEGQALGMWLRENHPDVFYAYLTSMPVVWDSDIKGSKESTNNTILLDKRKYPPAKLGGKLCQLYNER